MSGWPARLDASGRVVRCHNDGECLGRIWIGQRGDRHLYLRNSFGPRAGIWRKTRHAKAAEARGGQPYRDPMPVAKTLSSTINEVAIEPAAAAYPLIIECPRCEARSRIEPLAIDVVVPSPADPPQLFKTVPLTDPFFRIGLPDED